MTVPRIDSATRRPIKHYAPARRIVLAVCAVLLLAIIVVNATPGHFDYPDTDGCACFVTYTTHPSRASCAQLRPGQCHFQLNDLLIFFSFVDFNR
jgi:hypothetical protein